jgi:ribosomal protein RSM22 (predicted rRNA methylase)
MRPPAKLRDEIERLTETAPVQRLRQAAEALTERYRSGVVQTAAIRSDDERLAYLLVRVPATFAALTLALRAAKRQLTCDSVDTLASDGRLAIETMLDLGAGPGTAAWAACETFPELRRLRLIERDLGFIGLGRQLFAAGESPVLRQAEWLHSDLNGSLAESTPTRVTAGRVGDPDAFDLVVASYSWGELSPARQLQCLRQAWQRTRKLLVLVEPGTRAGFGCIHQARSELIALGASLLAPCPHSVACPMAGAGDWCHFAARVERTAVHRRLKDGELGYEDEKFSYVAATPLAPRQAEAEQRIVRHPMYHSGFVELQLCSASGIVKRNIGRSKKNEYRAARRAAWGDLWPAPQDAQ